MSLSVVIPAHNAAGTLAETLESLRAQTRTDWEALVVDDGSTDGTAAIAEKQARRDGRIRLLPALGLRQGAAAARNRGIAAATGRWLLFLDADDLIEPPFMARMLGRLETDGSKVAYCGSRRLTPDGRRGPGWFAADVAVAPFERLTRDWAIAMHGAVVDRALVVEQGGFDDSLRAAEDLDFFIRIARTGVPFRPVPEILALYRMRAGSLSMQTRLALADTLRVVDRAYGADSRAVNPSPQHAGGVDPALCSKEMALGLHALSFAASEIGQGGHGLDLLLPLPDRHGDLVERCRQTILSGVAFGAQRLEDELPDDPQLAARVAALLPAVEAAAGRPGLARQLGFLLEPDLLRPPHPRNRTTAGASLLVRQEIDRPTPILVSDRVDRVLVEFRHAGRVLARAEAPALGHLSTGDTMRLALDSVGIGPVIRAGRWLRRPSFWFAGARAGARLGVDLATRGWPRHGTRGLARHALGEAALAAAGGLGAAGRALDALIAEGRGMAARAVPAGRPSAAAPSGARAETHQTTPKPGTGRTERLPILAYGGGASPERPELDAFERQMRWLKSEGYWTVTSADLHRHFADRRPFAGRPVMIVFEGARGDFPQTVWPVLREQGFAAELFVDPDLLCCRGPRPRSAEFLSWEQIRDLAAEGAGFGSRLADGRPLADLPSRDLALEAARSRATLERALGRPCCSFAASDSAVDERFLRIVRRCGYEIGLSAEPGHADLAQDPLHLPRVQARNTWSLDAFAAAVRST
ncbi:glycosyltransferase [Reyranella sp.]|uniref:glycosyltransferase n=1 Tax=Reyranella sp. TaxID=1929291 RepID=UPI003BAD300C